MRGRSPLRRGLPGRAKNHFRRRHLPIRSALHRAAGSGILNHKARRRTHPNITGRGGRVLRCRSVLPRFLWARRRCPSSIAGSAFLGPRPDVRCPGRGLFRIRPVGQLHRGLDRQALVCWCLGSGFPARCHRWAHPNVAGRGRCLPGPTVRRLLLFQRHSRSRRPTSGFSFGCGPFCSFAFRPVGQFHRRLNNRKALSRRCRGSSFPARYGGRRAYPNVAGGGRRLVRRRAQPSVFFLFFFRCRFPSQGDRSALCRPVSIYPVG